MRPWLLAMLAGTLKPDHLGICDRCAAEFHGQCLKAQISYLKYGKCRCHRRGCAMPKYKPPAFRSRGRKDDSPRVANGI
jgi:hypothetical protein